MSRTGRRADRAPPRRGVVVHVVHAGQAGHEPLDGIVRTRDPAQQVEDREPDRDDDPLQDPEDEHRHRGRQGDRHLGGPERGDPAELGDVDEPDAGVHDHGGERRRRESPNSGRITSRATTVVSIVTAPASRVRPPAAVTDRRPAPAAAHREAVHQAGAQVHGAERQQLAVGVHAVPVPGREGARR